ncbi:MAG: hypothetical protein AAB451_01950 [Patescibacteria group bacterium]
MIKLSNGHELEFLTASGALAFDGRGWPWEWPLFWAGLIDPHLFTVITKNILSEPVKGNLRLSRPWDVVKFISEEGKEIHPLKALINPGSIGGVINAIGLTGPGIEKWLERDYPVINRQGYKVIVSITGPEGGKGCVEIARRLNGLSSVMGIEVNASCPNTDPTLLQNAETVVRLVLAIKKVSDHPILLKLSYAQPYLEIARILQGTVEAISLNTIPWKTIFGEIPSPLAKYGGGGISGPVAKPLTRIMIEDLARETKIPIIGSGVWDYADIQRLWDFGASAISFGTIFLRWPWKPTQYIRRWRKGFVS